MNKHIRMVNSLASLRAELTDPAFESTVVDVRRKRIKPPPEQPLTRREQAILHLRCAGRHLRRAASHLIETINPFLP